MTLGVLSRDRSILLRSARIRGASALALAIALGVAISAGASGAKACSCVGTSLTVLERYHRADVVFDGVVRGFDRGRRVLVVEVISVLKGQLERVVELPVDVLGLDDWESSCGVPIESLPQAGSRRVFFHSRGYDACTATFEQGSEAYRVLTRMDVPTVRPSRRAGTGCGSCGRPTAPGIAASGLSLAAGLGWIRRWRRAHSWSAS